MVVETKRDAWSVANALMPSDYGLDIGSTERAGYPVFRSYTSYYDYICDLGNGLEVNLSDGKSHRIFVRGE
jgi:hypothetical protein